MINVFDSPREKARKNLRILKLLMLSSIIVAGYFGSVQNWIGLSGSLCLIFYFLGSFVTLKNVKEDLKE